MLSALGLSALSGVFGASGVPGVPGVSVRNLQTCVAELNDANFHFALSQYYTDPVAATAIYGYPINSWCVHEVTDMYGAFTHDMNTMVEFNEDISGWNVSKVTNMMYMFGNTWSFNQDLSKWNVSKVTSFEWMFGGGNCHDFNQDFCAWSAYYNAQVNYDHMFSGSGCPKKDSPISENGPWCSLSCPITGGPTNSPTSGTPTGAPTTAEPTAPGQCVTEINDTNFKGALAQYFADPASAHSNYGNPINTWCVHEVTDMSLAFRNLPFNDDISDWNVSKVKDMGNMFFDARSFNQDLSKWDVSKVTSFEWMFGGAHALNQDFCTWSAYYNAQVTYDFMFSGSGCPKQDDPTSEDGPWCSLSCPITGEPTNSPTSGAPTAAPTTAGPTAPGQCPNELNDANFKDALAQYFEDPPTANTLYGNPINTWCVHEVTNMDAAFYQQSFNDDISDWNVSKVTTMGYLFAKSDFNKDLSKWNVSKVMGMHNMFELAYQFNQNLSKWDVGKVKDMSKMFWESYSFNQDLSKWDVSKVMTFEVMFHGAHALNQDFCTWGAYYSDEVIYGYMFGGGTGCPNQYSPTSEYGPWCSSSCPISGEPTNSPTSGAPTGTPTTAAPTPPGVSTTAGPTTTPTAVHISMTINSSLSVQNLTLPLTSSSQEVLEDTIKDVVKAGIDTTSQSVKDATIIGPSGAVVVDGPSRVLVRTLESSLTNLTYELTLEERCSALCDAQIDGTSMYEKLTSHMSREIDDGGFSAALQANALVCGSECDAFKDIFVESGTFEKGIVEVTTSTAPTYSPWTVGFLGIVSGFTLSSEDELVMRYEIGKNHTYETFLYKKDCVSNITDITVNTTKVEKQNKNTTHDLLTLSYSFDKAAIANSTIWNSTNDNIVICQVVNLVVPEANGLLKMVIVEDIREVNIDFNLSINDFTVDTELGAATTEAVIGATSVSSYVVACKCGRVNNFTCDSGALSPNTQLYVCIKSISTDIKIEKLMSMMIRQGENKMNVIDDGTVKIPSIADMEYVTSENGVVVYAFVPTNIFNYVAGASINITGSIDMKLSGSTRNLLASVVDDGAFSADRNGKMSYELNVNLQEESTALEEGELMDSSGAFLARTSGLLGMALLFSSGVW